MAADLVLGIDVGTTAVKLAVVGLDGALHHSFSRAYPIHRPADGRAEQDPSDWTALIDSGIAELVAAGLGPRIAAIGVTSQVNTHVFLDGAGQPLMPAIVWQDVRSAGVAAELAARVTVDDLLRWFGAPIPIDASHPLSRMDWARRHAPEVWDRTRWVVLPKDYCIFHLTGEMVTDAVSNIGICNAEGPVAEALALVPGAAERVAPALPADAVAGRVRQGQPLAGVPVVVTTMDGWCAVFGGAGGQQGAGVHVSGTSEILGIVSATVTPTPGVVVFPELLGLRLHAGPTQAGGAALQWFCDWSGLSVAQVNAMVAATPRKATTPIFLPQLQGERAPLWNASLRGAFLGMDQSTGMADLARAVMEGVAFSARHVMQALETSAGVRPEMLTCGGGGFRSPVWTRIKADVMGRPLRPLRVNEPGILGAAALAAKGAGLFPDLAAAHAAIVARADPILPDPKRVAMYDDLFGIYTDAIATNAALHARMVARAEALSKDCNEIAPAAQIQSQPDPASL